MAAVGTLLTQRTHELQQAIRSGNVEQSEQLARQLAEQRAQLIVNVDETCSVTAATSGEMIRLKVNFEGRCFSSGNATVTFDVNPAITFQTLKQLVCKRFGYPPDLQRCIIGRLCMEDDKVLTQCGLQQTSEELFIYLLSSEPLQLDATPGFVSSADTWSEFHTTFTLPDSASASSVTNAAMSTTVQTVGHSSAGAMSAHPSAGTVPGHTSAGAMSAHPSAGTVPGHTSAGTMSGHTLAGAMSAHPSEGTVPGHTSAVAMSGHTSAGTMSAGHTATFSVPADSTRQFQPQMPELQPWSCSRCTYENHYSMPMCEMCDTPRLSDAQDCDVIDMTDNVPEDEVDNILSSVTAADDMQPSTSRQNSIQRMNYDDLLAMEYCNLIENTETFQCPICFDDIDPGCGVVLRDCLHCFCRTCLADHIGYSENAVVTCPFNNGDYNCQSELQDREIRALVTDEVYERHLLLSAREAESCAAQSYHCATPDCAGWCTYEDDVNTFFCYACRHVNCLTCRAIHEGQDCREYQRELQMRAHTDRAAMLANSTLEELLKTGDAMKCPRCDVVIIKKDGCDWIMCTVCKLEICWVTQQARWGPAGRGDTSGGCRCRVEGKLCHPRCQNCH